MFEEQEGRQEESVVCGAFLSYLDLLLHIDSYYGIGFLQNLPLILETVV